jgi:hypothetical protein
MSEDSNAGTATLEAPKAPVTMPDAPDGSHFDSEEVKTAKGQSSLGHVPILVWDDLNKATEFYGAEAICDVLDGTSLRVSFQNIARRFKIANKSDAEIATAMVGFRPGKRTVGASTPASRAASMAKKATEKVGGGESVEKLLAKIASGELSQADLEALVS